MGQRIQVTVIDLDEIAVFSTDRSITGQVGQTYESRPKKQSDPSEVLAGRLFEQLAGVNHVHVMSNIVTVRFATPWDTESLAAASTIVSDLFIFYDAAHGSDPAEDDETLRQREYNATISFIRAHNEDLWVMRMKPDTPVAEFQAGQYTTLALGYWEPRADDAVENIDAGQREKLARRSYSVSSSIIDETGKLVGPHPDEVEFYIVKVRAGEQETPALTPRIFTKVVGDRIFMGAKFSGHYTLDGVGISDNVVFLATGTGEAPHNAMTAELLRRGHQGNIVSVVCVRYRKDLAYTDQHAVLMERYPNYQYVTLATREPDTIHSKVYIQDLVVSGRLETEAGMELDPSNTHAYLCGNPAMIGLPDWSDDGSPVFPKVLGMCQVLYERGFTIDRRRERGNVHYEEYWKDRGSLE